MVELFQFAILTAGTERRRAAESAAGRGDSIRPTDPASRAKSSPFVTTHRGTLSLAGTSEPAGKRVLYEGGSLGGE